MGTAGGSSHLLVSCLVLVSLFMALACRYKKKKRGREEGGTVESEVERERDQEADVVLSFAVCRWS